VTQSDERGAELREFFFETAQELLQTLNDEALKLEKLPGDLETVRSIRRIVHTLKGDAAACGFRELSESAHQLEDALAQESSAAHASLAEMAFAAADFFAATISAYRTKSKLPSVAPLRKMVRELLEASKKTAKKSRSPKKPAAGSISETAWTEYEKVAVNNAAGAGHRVFHILARIDPHCAMPIAGRQLLLNALFGLGEVLGTRPDPSSSAPSKEIEVLVASDCRSEQISAKCSIPTVISSVHVEVMKEPAETPARAATSSDPPSGEAAALDPPAEPAAVEPAPPEREEVPAPKPAAAGAENILRVDAERIDNVLNLVGELIIGKSMLQQALNEFARTFPKEAMRGRFADAMAFQSRVLNDLQRSVMKIRMVPVEQLFRRFPRMIRDVAKQCGKEVDLSLTGQDTDLDKSLLDAITEPLNHLVRNAISHGIESAEDRTRAGKPPHGTLQLKAYHQGNQVVVEVTDDGRGIDLQKVRARAVEKGLISAAQAAVLSDADAQTLVFRPGFSTADQVTEISGRGVGLDVVQSVLQRLKGTVDMDSRFGQGTTFRLKLPLTLAIIKALLFRVEQRLYAIPLNSVAEIARARESDLHRVDHYEVLQLRGQVLPLLRLGRPPALADDGAAKLFVLVITMGERKLGLIVNTLEGEEELVIKALDDQTVATDLVSGASILGDGRVVLILNLAALLDRFNKTRPQEAGAVSSGLLLSEGNRAQARGAGTEAGT
jgi:two-component system, chemotaxis family, sensor kinase CheA